MNFKTETLEALKESGKSTSDIVWIGSYQGDRIVDIDEFFRDADFRYDAGYGAQEIAGDLVIVGDNWWLERKEYDGSEWWEFKITPTLKPNNTKVKLEELL